MCVMFVFYIHIFMLLSGDSLVCDDADNDKGNSGKTDALIAFYYLFYVL